MRDERDERDDDGWGLLEGGAPDGERRVLLLPANMATAAFYADMLADPALAEAGVRAVAATPPGFGGRRPASPADLDVERYALLVEDRALAGRFDVLVGHSLSAQALAEVARRDRFRGGLVLVAPALRPPDQPQVDRTLAALSRVPVMRTAVWFGMMRGLSLGLRGELPDARRAALVAEMRRNPTRVHRRWLVASADHLAMAEDLTPALLAARGPVRVVRGTDDAAALDDASRVALERAAHADVVDVPDAGHFVIVQRPEAVNAVVLEVLDALERPGPGPG